VTHPRLDASGLRMIPRLLLLAVSCTLAARWNALKITSLLALLLNAPPFNPSLAARWSRATRRMPLDVSSNLVAKKNALLLTLLSLLLLSA
jgi:hypothetical protein